MGSRNGKRKIAAIAALLVDAIQCSAPRANPAAFGHQLGGMPPEPSLWQALSVELPTVSSGPLWRSAAVTAALDLSVYRSIVSTRRERGQQRAALCRVRAVEQTAELERERRLAEQAQAGDRAALGKILQLHGPRLYRSVLLPRLGSPSAAEEALSTTYVKVIERFEQFQWQSVGVYPWLRVVALRVAIDLLRKRKREVLFEASDLERELDSSSREERDAQAHEQHDLAVARKRVEALLDAINPRYQTAIRSRILEGRSREQAAAELEISVSTFDVVLHRAMAALKKVLVAAGDEA